MTGLHHQVRALGLSSGGLDSILSAVVLRNQGIDVEWISFETPFFSASKARQASRKTGIPITVQNITQVYVEMLKDPHCGYGRHMNPCLDCHALMFKLAGKVMAEKGFHFLFSGEVLGQRPMSQTHSSLRYVEKHSGYEGYILRPLSAKKMPETIPEKTGLVNRELLFDFSGRSRKPQMELAKVYQITDYPTPAGGCLLTDKLFSYRLRDLFTFQKHQSERDFYLLKYGRHFRMNADTKIIVGRTKIENESILEHYDQKTDTLLKIKDFPGPTALIPMGCSQETLILGASVCIYYSKAPDTAWVQAVSPNGSQLIQPVRITGDEIGCWMISEK